MYSMLEGIDRAALAERVRSVRERMARAAERAGRDPASVGLLAISKRHPAGLIAAARELGVTHVGESYAQEMLAKQEALAGDARAADLVWHFVGRLQRNKARQVVGRVALIHSVDSTELAGELARRAAPGSVQAILISVSAAGEEQKTGIEPARVPELLAAIGELPALECRGLMTMPPYPEAPEDSRRYFRALRALRDQLATASVPLPDLSMGTTGDLEVAVEEGATWVRVGTALFGPRTYP
jgi:hypothetical protein